MPSNSELLQIGFDAWNHDDCEAWLKVLEPGIEVRTAGVFPDLAPVYHGHKGAARFWRELREPWEVFRIDAERIEAEGDLAMAAVRFRATGVDSGVKVDMRFGHAIRIRDGLATVLVNRRTLEEARDALLETQPAAPATGSASR
jgi:ketosteroid isomerase-like protein